MGETGYSRRKAQSGLNWLGEKRDQPNESSSDLAVTSQIQDQGAKWANLSAEELVFHVSIGYSVLRPYANVPFSEVTKNGKHRS
jgi:hypothetical protein